MRTRQGFLRPKLTSWLCFPVPWDLIPALFYTCCRLSTAYDPKWTLPFPRTLGSAPPSPAPFSGSG